MYSKPWTYYITWQTVDSLYSLFFPTRSNIDSHTVVKGLDTIADIPKDSGFPSVYAKVASRVNSILPFIKIAYPDMMGGDSSKDLEPLNVKDRRVCR
jgi:hypothetical protein